MKASAFSTNTQLRFALNILDCVLGPLCLVWHTQTSPYISEVLEASQEDPWSPLGLPCQLKKPFKGLWWRQGSYWEEQKGKIFPPWGVIDLPPKKIMDLPTFWSTYKCSKMRCTGKMAPPDENLVNAHSQHRQNFSSGPGKSSFWTLVMAIRTYQ